MNDICNELQLRQQRQRNLVIFGLGESNNDAEEVEALVCDVGVVAAISAVYRVGAVVENRPRTPVIRFETEQNRDGVYNNLRSLRGKQRWIQISVVPDFTKTQCQEEKATFKQGRIHGNPVADGWAGAVVRKPLSIQQCDGRTDGPTDGPTDTAKCRVACPRLKIAISF